MMNLTRTMNEMGDVYSSLLEEKTSEKGFAKGSFEVIANKKEAAKKKEVFVDQKNTGPENAENVNVKAISDPKNLKNKETFQGVENLSSQNFNENSEKIESKKINNFMSKSVFDKLFEDVMGSVPSDEQDALTLGAVPGAEDAGTEEGGDEVTITLPRDLAHKLHELLAAVVEGEKEEELDHEEASGEEGAGDEAAAEEANEEDDSDEEDDSEEGNQEVAGEATELKEVPASAGQSLQNKNNKVGGTVDSLVAKGHGEGKVKSEVDGKGKDLPDSHGAKLQNKNNKVPNKHNTGDYLFKK